MSTSQLSLPHEQTVTSNGCGFMAIVLKDITTLIQERTTASWLGSPAPVEALHQHEAVHGFAFYEVAFVDDLAVLM